MNINKDQLPPRESYKLGTIHTNIDKIEKVLGEAQEPGDNGVGMEWFFTVDLTDEDGDDVTVRCALWDHKGSGMYSGNWSFYASSHVSKIRDFLSDKLK